MANPKFPKSTKYIDIDIDEFPKKIFDFFS